jgi:DNA (cytosine-5)-methyltransferase 1
MNYNSVLSNIDILVKKKPHMSYLKDIYDTEYLDALNKFFKKNSELKIGTDCSGIEAPIMALQVMSIPHIHQFSCEIDESAKESIKANYAPSIQYDDITTRKHKELPSIDGYFCGFPCQSFSGLRGDIRLGLDDPTRGSIFFHCFSVIKYKQPKFFILENVKGLLTIDDGNTFDTIMKKLNSLKNYNIHWSVLNTKNYNIPQNRPRLYIVGIRKDFQKREFKFPEEIPLKVGIKKILTRTNEQSQITDHMKNLLRSFNIDLNEDYVVNLNIGGKDGSFKSVFKGISPCLLAGNSRFYITSKKRFITPREALRLQGFPDTFDISAVSSNKIYKQAGNSMSVNILANLIKSIILSI